jgi:hypothetical protein
MTSELPKSTQDRKERGHTVIELNGRLTEDQKTEIENTVGRCGPFFFYSTEDKREFLAVFELDKSYEETWLSFKDSSNQKLTLLDAGLYLTSFDTTRIDGDLPDLTDKHISRDTIKQSRDYLRDTLGIQVEDAFEENSFSFSN